MKYLKLLKKTCLTVEKVANARVASVLVYRGIVISIGTNQRKSHPFQARFGKNTNAIFLHAETDCLYRASKLLSPDEIAKSDMYVCRIKHVDGVIGFGLAKPCLGCCRAIATYGVRNVFYTTDNGYEVL